MTARRAALAVCALAADAADAALLLTALGLLSAGRVVWPAPPSGDVRDIKQVASIGAPTRGGYQ